MSKEPNFGPYGEWANVADFSALSERAFMAFHDEVDSQMDIVSTPTQHLFLRMAYQAETTSLGIRLNNSWALCIPAFSMTRTRLEQTILCSYLIHEEESKGLVPYVKYIPIGEYRGLKSSMEEPSLAEHLQHFVDLDQSRDEAIKAQEEFAPGFTIENDKFVRKWTKLDLRSMARRRDKLVSQSHFVLKHSLEREYLSIYKVASSVVHSECSSLSFRFLDLFPSPTGKPVLMARPSWAMIVTASTAHYDILQCYEILTWLGVSCDDVFQSLMAKWIENRDKHVH